MTKKAGKNSKNPTVSDQSVKVIEAFHFSWKDKWNLLACLLISLAGIIIYFRTLGYEYVLDDVMMIQENKFTNEGFGGVFKHLTNESMTGYFGEQKNLLPGNRYRPLSLMTFSIEKGILGKLSPALGHFNNILLYILTGILIFIVFRYLFTVGKERFSFVHETTSFHLPLLLALLFMVHPLHVEAVANVKGRDELMSLLLSILALYFYAKSIRENSTKHLYFGVGAYFLALLSKENAITWLVVIPLSLYVFNYKEYLKPVKSLLITTGFYMVWRSAMSGMPKFGDVGNDIMNNPFLGMDFIEKNATVLFTLLKYIQLLVLPYPLTHDYYPYAIPKMDLGNWQVWLSIALHAGLVWVAVSSFKKRPLLSYGILFYLITLSIVSNVVINVGTFMNDRFVYMPSLGYCFLLVLGIYYLVNRLAGSFNNTYFYGLGSLIIIPYFILSLLRVPAWENNLSLNKAAFPASQNSARANSFMSTALYNEYKNGSNLSNDQKIKLLQQARPYALKSLKIIPDYHNANLMLAGIAGEMYRYTRNLDPLLEDFYIIAMQRPDIEQKRKADGSLSSFITEYLSYLNTAVPGDEKLKVFYQKLLTDMQRSNKPVLSTWKVQIAKTAQQGFMGSPEISSLANEILRTPN